MRGAPPFGFTQRIEVHYGCVDALDTIVKHLVYEVSILPTAGGDDSSTDDPSNRTPGQHPDFRILMSGCASRADLRKDLFIPIRPPFG